MGYEGAAEYHTLKTDHRDLTLEEWANIWNDLDHPIACTSLDVMLEQKANLEKLCSNYNACTYEQKELVKKMEADIVSYQAKQKTVTRKSK